MKMTEAKENKTSTLVLARVAEYQKSNLENPCQKDILKKVGNSKGSISQKFNRLTSQEFVMKNNDNTYSINEEKLVSVYRDHLEDYLIREEKNETFANSIEGSNKVRTTLKRQINILLGRKENKKLLKSFLIYGLISSIGQDNIKNLREVFLWVDNIIRQAAYNIFSNNVKEDNNWMKIKFIYMLSICLNRHHGSLDSIAKENEFLNNHFPGKPFEKIMIEKYFGGKEQ